jgi:hypothetical protein
MASVRHGPDLSCNLVQIDATTYITRSVTNLDRASPSRVTVHCFDEPPETGQDTPSLFDAGRNVLECN